MARSQTQRADSLGGLIRSVPFVLLGLIPVGYYLARPHPMGGPLPPAVQTFGTLLLLVAMLALLVGAGVAFVRRLPDSVLPWVGAAWCVVGVALFLALASLSGLAPGERGAAFWLLVGTWLGGIVAASLQVARRGRHRVGQLASGLVAGMLPLACGGMIEDPRLRDAWGIALVGLVGGPVLGWMHRRAGHGSEGGWPAELRATAAVVALSVVGASVVAALWQVRSLRAPTALDIGVMAVLDLVMAGALIVVPVVSVVAAERVLHRQLGPG